MPPSTVRSLKSYSDGKNYRVRGRHITEDEKNHLLNVKKEVEEALGDNGRILVRASGTEPLLRVMVEAETEELCKQYVTEVIDAMKSVM